MTGPPCVTSSNGFLSTLSLRRATLLSIRNTHNFGISIHALLAESDQHQRMRKGGTQQFLSTLSLRRATESIETLRTVSVNFYPRSPCGERPVHYDNYNLHCTISIHALLAESDSGHDLWGRVRQGFLSTLSLRRATSIRHIGKARGKNFYPRSPCGERQTKRWNTTERPKISIHALLAESDLLTLLITLLIMYFYPRSPCGERLTR